MTLDWSALPGLDAEGFGSVERLRALARRAPEDLAQAYPVPGLLLEGATAEVAARAQRVVQDRERSFARTMQGEGEEVEELADAERYVGRVAFLAKRPRGLFPDMVTVGRALNSDITFVVGSVSKVHGYFRDEGGGAWSFNDQRATNGTLVNERRLAPGERVPLRDGDRLQFGSEIACTFLLPASLARRLAGAASSRP